MLYIERNFTFFHTLKTHYNQIKSPTLIGHFIFYIENISYESSFFIGLNERR